MIGFNVVERDGCLWDYRTRSINGSAGDSRRLLSVEYKGQQQQEKGKSEAEVILYMLLLDSPKF